jgi:hypothetical protein
LLISRKQKGLAIDRTREFAIFYNVLPRVMHADFQTCYVAGAALLTA